MLTQSMSCGTHLPRCMHAAPGELSSPPRSSQEPRSWRGPCVYAVSCVVKNCYLGLAASFLFSLVPQMQLLHSSRSGLSTTLSCSTLLSHPRCSQVLGCSRRGSVPVLTARQAHKHHLAFQLTMQACP